MHRLLGRNDNDDGGFCITPLSLKLWMKRTKFLSGPRHHPTLEGEKGGSDILALGCKEQARVEKTSRARVHDACVFVILQQYARG